jgi:hypothetical protein
MADNAKVPPTFDLAHHLAYRATDLAIIGGRLRERISTPKCGLLLRPHMVEEIREAIAKIQNALSAAVAAQEAND